MRSITIACGLLVGSCSVYAMDVQKSLEYGLAQNNVFTDQKSSNILAKILHERRTRLDAAITLLTLQKIRLKPVYKIKSQVITAEEFNDAKRFASKGDKAAMIRVAECYRRGLGGAKKNDRWAQFWHNKAMISKKINFFRV